MPITKGAIRKQKADKKKAKVNVVIRKSMVRSVALMRRQSTEKNLKAVYSRLDRAVKKKVIHKNKAARIKSRLSKRVLKKKK